MKATTKSFVWGVLNGVMGLLLVEFCAMLWFSKMQDPEDMARSFGPPPIAKDRLADHSEIYGVNVTSVRDGKMLPLSSYRDKVVFLNVWATWCKPCVAEMPSIARLRDAVKGRNVEFVILSDEEIEKVRAFEEKRKLNLPFFTVPDSLPPAFEGNSVPRTYIIKNGRIEFSHLGSAKWDDKSVVDLLKGLSTRI